MALFDKNRFTQTRTDWPTPKEVFDKLNREFNFNLDPCADVSNAKCQKYFTKEIDGLTQNWEGKVFCNPPYGTGMIKWLSKALIESETGKAVVVCLIPARTNTSWWVDICMKAAEIRFIRGRPKFGDAKHGLPQPLALVIFKKHFQKVPVIGTFEMD